MSTPLSRAIDSGVPLLWHETEEPSRTIQSIADFGSDTRILRFDSIDSTLKTYTEETPSGKGQWVPFLLEPNDAPNTKVQSLNRALETLVSLKVAESVLLILPASVATGLANLVIDFNFEYRKTWTGEGSAPRRQVLALASSEDEIPPILIKEVYKTEEELPTPEELAALVQGPDALEVANSGLGLTSFEFRLAHKEIMCGDDADDVVAEMHRRKREILRGNDVLDLRKPKLTLDDVGGMDNAKELVNRVKWAWENPEAVKELGVHPLRRLLMIGVPGVGKSLTCEAIASTLKTDLAKGGISQSMSKWIGESEQNVRKMFKALNALAPIVFWIDEFGRDLAGGDHDGGAANRSHGEFLTGIQELPEDVFFAAAANRIEDLPPEMTRADRFDAILFSGFPTFEERLSIFKIHLSKNVSYDVDALASSTQYFTGAEIKHLIKKTTFESAYTHGRAPTTEELLSGIPKVKSRVWINHRPSIIDMYEHAVTEWEWASSSQEMQAEKVLSDARSGVKGDVRAVARYNSTENKSKMTFN